MRVRKRCLPEGWYPVAPGQAVRALERMRRPAPPDSERGIAGIVPHAGWEYSGSLALEVLSCMSRSMDTIVIIGGHLGPADGILCMQEDAYETPFGQVTADLELLRRLRKSTPMREDRQPDNTVEVQLPLVRHLFPDAMALGLRAAPSPAAVELGESIADAARDLGRRVVVAGSTDLTHYGAAYGFMPAGSGPDALRWVREVNDHRMIESMLAMDVEGVLERAARDHSACSAGGALAAISYARRSGASRGRLVRYATSCDVQRAESFVGYAGVLYA